MLQFSFKKHTFKLVRVKFHLIKILAGNNFKFNEIFKIEKSEIQ